MVSVFIDTHDVNIAARLARHAKLELQSQVQSAPVPSSNKVMFFGRVCNGLPRLLGIHCESTSISRLVRKTVAISVAFLLFSSFGPMYSLTEGSFWDEGADAIDFVGGDTGNLLADIMTEDGFLLKPALNSTAGDRSTANEIFAYQVEPGDTLSSLAQRFGIKKETLVMENGLWNVNSLKTGMTLKILPVDGISHVVKKGDTVDKIAKKYSVKAEDIARQNQLEEGQTLAVDSALIIPGAKKEVAPPVSYAGGGSSAPSNPGAYAYSGQVSGRLIWPASGKLTQRYHAGHYAIDIGNRSKGPIYAAAAGKVIKASYGWNGGYGNYVIIDHGDGMQTLYGHNEKLYVEEGQYVDQGQTIAWMGRSGRVYGPTGIHLHFEVRIKGVKYNPLNFF